MCKKKWTCEFISVSQAGKGFWIILDDANNGLGWEIEELTHLKVYVSLDECISLQQSK